jgi:hypothetical protein
MNDTPAPTAAQIEELEGLIAKVKEAERNADDDPVGYVTACLMFLDQLEVEDEMPVAWGERELDRALFTEDLRGLRAVLSERDALLAAAKRAKAMETALALCIGRLELLLPAPLPESDHPSATQYVIDAARAALVAP